MQKTGKHAHTDSGVEIAANKPIYCAYSKDGEHEMRLHVSEENAIKGGSKAELIPVIYYRVASPITAASHQKLASFSLDKFFKRVKCPKGQPNSEINFIVGKADVTKEDMSGINITDPVVDSLVDGIFNFTKDEDIQLI